MPRWQVDDEPFDLSSPHLGQLDGDDLEVPVHRQRGVRVEITKTARGEGGQILPQDGVVLSPGQVFDDSRSGVDNRALICSITFPSASVKPEVSGESASVWPSISRMMLSRSFIARKSAVAERLTS